jgi:ribosomal protein S27AE
MKGEAGFQTTSNKFKDKLAHGMKDSIPITPGALLSDSDENEFKRRDEETQLRVSEHLAISRSTCGHPPSHLPLPSEQKIAAISKEIENDEEIFKNQILCPRCGSPAGQEELQRWGHCGMCRQADISEPLV